MYKIEETMIVFTYTLCKVCVPGITSAWSGGYSVRLAVGRPGLDSLAELDKKTLKVGIHSFPAWR